MSHQERRAAYRVAKEIWDVERDQDASIARAATMLANLCNARLELNSPACTTQEAIILAAELVQHQVAARGKWLELHGALQTFAGKMGLQEFATGGDGKLPPTPLTEGALRLVGAEAA